MSNVYLCVHIKIIELIFLDIFFGGHVSYIFFYEPFGYKFMVGFSEGLAQCLPRLSASWWWLALERR